MLPTASSQCSLETTHTVQVGLAIHCWSFPRLREAKYIERLQQLTASGWPRSEQCRSRCFPVAKRLCVHVASANCVDFDISSLSHQERLVDVSPRCPTVCSANRVGAPPVPWHCGGRVARQCWAGWARRLTHHDGSDSGSDRTRWTCP